MGFPNWLRRLPVHRRKESELNAASHRVRIAIDRYKDIDAEIQREIERNHIARNLLYDKGGADCADH